MSGILVALITGILSSIIAPSPGVEPEVVFVPVLNGPFSMTLMLDGFEKRSPSMKSMILSGTMLSGAVNISVIVEPDRPHAEGKVWRDRFLKRVKENQKVTEFESAGVACAEYTLGQDLFATKHWNAYPTAAGFSFDIHVSASSGSKTKFDRSAFEKIVASFAIDAGRTIAIFDYPVRLKEVLRAAWRRSPDEITYLEKERLAKPKSVEVALALAEVILARAIKERPADAEAAYKFVIENLPKSDFPVTERSLMAALAEEGLAMASMAGGKPEEGLAHLDKVESAARDAAKGVRAAFTMSVVRIWTIIGSAEKVAPVLDRAIALEPSFRDEVLESDDFKSVRDDPAVRAVLEKKPASRPAK